MSSKRQKISSSSVSYHEDPSSFSSSSLSSICFNEDLMTEIFLRLPVKSILRFRCLSKQWKSQLSNPLFIRRHASRKSPNSFMFSPYRTLRNGLTSLCINVENYKFYTVDFSYLLQSQILKQNKKRPNFKLVSSCNGLLLFRRTTLDPIKFNHSINAFYICNPSTRKYSELEQVPEYIAIAPRVSASLAFDPCTSPYYKVVFFWINHYEWRNPMNDFCISIYSSETKSWKLLDYTSKISYPWPIPGTFFNGAICWAHRAKRSLHYFDINKESFNLFPNPPPNSSSGHIDYFGAYGDHLHLILNYQKELVVDVFELKEDYSGWVPKYKVNMIALAVEYKFESCILQCLFYNDEEPVIVVASVCPQLLAYNLREKSMTKIVHPEDNDKYSSNIWSGLLGRPLHCIETLFEIE